MKYENLYSDFKSLFPEHADEIENIAKKVSAEPSDGMHIMFGMVVVPFVLVLLSKNKDIELNKAFVFFEEMAHSEDSLISEVLEFSILEELISQDEEILKKLKTYMGYETYKSCSSLEKFFSPVDH